MKKISYTVLFIMLFVVVVALYGAAFSVNTTQNTTFTFSGTGNNGDTNFYTAWTKSTDGGPWNGGFLLGWSGDAWFSGVPGHMLAMKMDSYNPSNISGTSRSFVGGIGVNTLSSWGVPPDANCAGGTANETASGGYTPFSLRGNIYLPIQCQYGSPTFGITSEMIIVSPDNMQHYCNWANYKSGGTGGVNTCDSGNWSAIGDVVTSDPMTYKGIPQVSEQWALGPGNYGNKMGRMYCMPWGQDTVSGPVVPSGVPSSIDTNYTYCSSVNFTFGGVSTAYMHRFLTSGVPLNPTIWQHWNGSSWDSNWLNSASINLNGYVLNETFNFSLIYSQELHTVFARVNNTSLGGTLLYSTDMVNWNAMAPMIVQSAVGDNYLGWMPPTYTYDGGGVWHASHTNNGCCGSGYVLSFQQLTTTLIRPGNTQKSGKTVSGGKIIIQP